MVGVAVSVAVTTTVIKMGWGTNTVLTINTNLVASTIWVIILGVWVGSAVWVAVMVGVSDAVGVAVAVSVKVAWPISVGVAVMVGVGIALAALAPLTAIQIENRTARPNTTYIIIQGLAFLTASGISVGSWPDATK